MFLLIGPLLKRRWTKIIKVYIQWSVYDATWSTNPVIIGWNRKSMFSICFFIFFVTHFPWNLLSKFEFSKMSGNIMEWARLAYGKSFSGGLTFFTSGLARNSDLSKPFLLPLFFNYLAFEVNFSAVNICLSNQNSLFCFTLTIMASLIGEYYAMFTYYAIFFHQIKCKLI